MHTDHSKAYTFDKPITEHQVLEAAAEILACKYVREDSFTSSEATKEFLRFKLGKYEREVFAVMFLDSQHKLIDYQEVVKAVLNVNAAAVIFAHNHPSGISTPSQADIAITQRLTDALALIDVSVLDHIVVGQTTTSLAEKGLM